MAAMSAAPPGSVAVAVKATLSPATEDAVLAERLADGDTLRICNAWLAVIVSEGVPFSTVKVTVRGDPGGVGAANAFVTLAPESLTPPLKSHP
jgi:hypothetical protein